MRILKNREFWIVVVVLVAAMTWNAYVNLR